MERGKYVVIEGHDGTGKSTQVEMIRSRLARLGINSIEFHEPAGNPIADSIRTILKNGNIERDPMTDVLLFTAARCDIWKNLAKQALKQGAWAIAARSYYSSLAYQGYGSGIDLDKIEKITLMSTDDQYVKPDYAFILNLDDENERINRIEKRGAIEVPDTFESRPKDFQDRVKEGYLRIAKDKKHPIISANQSIDEISDELWSYLKNDHAIVNKKSL